MFLSRRGKCEVLLDRNQRAPLDVPLKPQDTADHVANFIDSIRNQQRPNADIEIGHLTASLCHLGNISMRLGRSLQFDPQKERFTDADQANELLARSYRKDHWAAPKPA